jgi:catechol 2,3-dioxygenase-like lactoylglutathione lyase family enzyme
MKPVSKTPGDLRRMAQNAVPGRTAATRPGMRLHHHAYVCSDHEQTRHFYEDVLGIPLVAFWIEAHEGDEVVSYSHAFYGLPDGSALAFFNFHDPEVQERFKAKEQVMFVHLAINVDAATQDEIAGRLVKHGFEPQLIEHGYTRSIYIRDPDGLLVEFACDPDDVEQINEWQQRTAHDALKRWQAGDLTVNNINRQNTAEV